MYPRFALSTLLAAAVVHADNHPWQAPSPSDRRSPCPLLNSLANHGFLRRSGRNITGEELIGALHASINLDPAAVRIPTAVALSTSQTGNDSTFGLDNLNLHGAIEHDGSLNPADTYFGDNHSFNWTIWNETRSYFGSDTISLLEAARARAVRLKSAAAINPQYKSSENGVQGTLLESAFYLVVFEDGAEARTEWVHIMFEQERLPYAEGYTQSANSITGEFLGEVSAKIVAAIRSDKADSGGVCSR